MKKFELTTDYIIVSGKKLFRIKALIQFGNVNPGDLGGYVEKEENLDQAYNTYEVKKHIKKSKFFDNIQIKLDFLQI